ncbi:MAG: TIGR00730 family Rossman fold protein [Paludibacteraceae bacterium]|nr:TIGR00730 family Rossman fold protein [Paludibacteraceae bacterium]
MSMNIGVFCSSSNDLLSVYHEEAQKLGAFIGQQQHTLVYGGSKNGLMESLAKEAHQHGAYIIGILPQDLRAHSSAFVDEVLMVESLAERKEMMKEYADVFIALPGGFGTLDEIFDVLAEVQIGVHDKKLLIVNIDHFYDALLEQFKVITERNFNGASNKNSYVVVNNATECIKYLTDNAL